MDCLRLREVWQQRLRHCQCKLRARRASLECRFVPVAPVLMAETAGQKYSDCARQAVGVRDVTEPL